jgi:hypothetical protein
MATGLHVLPDGSVMVAYGPRHVPISCAQYKANGYKPVLEKLAVKSPAVHKGAAYYSHIPRSSVASAIAPSSCTRQTTCRVTPPDAALVTHR